MNMYKIKVVRYIQILFLFAKQGGMHIRTECGTCKRLAIPTKPTLKQQNHRQEKQEAINSEKGL